jgi:3-hydroxyacyl-CoA dehydrogenase
VEIIRGPKTSDQTIATLAAHAKAIDKLPIIVADGPGFLINRLLLPYLTEALELLMEGAKIDMIESAATEFGMAKGPFHLMDEIGLDTTLQAGWSMASAFPDRIPVSPLLVALIKLGRLGQKSGAGFFSYADSVAIASSTAPYTATLEIIARWAKTTKQHSSEDIVIRLLLPMILEATRILEEGGWLGHLARKERPRCDPRDIDLGVIFGLGFPAQRGGLLWWADTIKPSTILEMLRPLESIGPRLQPTPLLLELAAHGERFY